MTIKIQNKKTERINKEWKAENFPLFSFQISDLWQGQTVWFPGGQAALSYANIVSCMCAQTHKRQTGHIRLFQTLHPVCVMACWLRSLTERPADFQEVPVCVRACQCPCVCVSVRDERKTDLAAALFCPAADSR